MNSSRTGLVFDQRYLHHRISQKSLENPGRVRSLYLTLSLSGYTERCRVIEPREATVDQVLTVHSAFYLDQIRKHAVNPDPFSYDRDSYVMEDSLITARLAAGGCMNLADQIMAGDLDQGFALIRPPGHHASTGRGMGFCILNNIALTAQYLKTTYGLSRILIVDFDAHHANGTQEIFYDTNEVMVLSVHQQGIFPFSGSAEETGVDKGLGYTINLPVYSQFGDCEYTFLLGQLLNAVCTQYLPQIILVSAGYDGHVQDSISQIRLSTRWFKDITMMLRFHAKQVCDSRLLLILEGGYNPECLEASILAAMDGLLEPKIEPVGVMKAQRADRVLTDHPLKQFWTL